MELKGSKTEANLRTAFAGECQARTKYTYYASKAKKDGYVQIGNLFMETAENEKEHAKIGLSCFMTECRIPRPIFWMLLKGKTMSGPICMRNLREPPKKRGLTILPICLEEWEKLKRSTRRDTANCWKMWKGALCSPETRI